MSLRERIGRWLWPEGVKAEADLYALRHNISDVWWWGVSTEACLTAAWLRNHDQYRRMTTEELERETRARMWPKNPLRAPVGELRTWMQSEDRSVLEDALRGERDRLGGKSPHPIPSFPAVSSSDTGSGDEQRSEPNLGGKG